MIIKGEAFWAKVLKPVPMYNAADGSEYVIDVTVDEETRKALTEAGLDHKIKPVINKKGKEHASGREYIKIDIPVASSKGTKLRAPKIRDKFGQDWDMDTLIGNGSKVGVMFDIRKGEVNGTPWRKPSLQEVIVIEHVPVEPAEQFDYEEAPVSNEEAW